MPRTLNSITLDSPASPQSLDVNDTFSFAGTPGFSGSGGVTRYDIKWEVDDGGGYVTIASSGTGLTTADTNPVVNSNSTGQHSITVTCAEAGSYTIRMAGAPATGGSYTVFSSTQTVEVSAPTPFSADLTAPDFGIDPQGVTRFNDYLAQVTAPAFAFTAQSLTRLNDWIGTLTAPTFSFTGQDLTWTEVTAFVAELTAASFDFTAQAMTRLNDTIMQLSTSAFNYTANALTRLNDWVGALSAPSFTMTALDMSWSALTGFIAQLSAATFGMTAQAISRFNEYMIGLSAPAFTFTAQAMTWFQDMVMVLSAAQMKFMARVMTWSDGTQQYIACIFHALTRKHRRIWRLLNGPSSPFQQ